MLRRLVALLPFISLAMIALNGCGGSSAGSSGDAGQKTSVAIGTATLTYVGSPTKFTSITGSNVSVVGMSGASFPSLVLNPQPNLSSCSLVYSAGTNHRDIWISSGNVPKQLSNSLDISYSPSIIPDGRVMFVRADPATQLSAIFTCYQDGTGVTQITHTQRNHGNPSWSPTGNKIAFYDGIDLFTVNPDGSGETKITTGKNPVISADGTKIFYDKQTSTTGPYHIYSIPIAGGTPVDLCKGDSTTDFQQPTASPDGHFLAYTRTKSSVSSIEVYDLKYPAGNGTVSIPSGSPAGWPSFTPDSKSILFAEGYPQVLLSSSLVGNQVSSVYLGTNTLFWGRTSMAPFLAPQPFVASPKGWMFDAPIAGFIWSQVQDQFASLLGFSATTASTAKITQVSTGNGDLVYALHADAITSLKWCTGYTIPPVSFTTNKASDILVSMSPTTGQFMTIAPFAVKQSGSISADGSHTFKGPFLAVYDSHGNNLAPSGAQNLTFNTKTGALQ